MGIFGPKKGSLHEPMSQVFDFATIYRIRDFVRKGRKVEKKGRKVKPYAVSLLCVLSVPLRPLRTKNRCCIQRVDRQPRR